MTALGQSRRFDLGLVTSSPPLSTDNDAPTRLVRFAPEADVGPALRRRPARCSSIFRIHLCGSLDESKLCQGRYAIVEADPVCRSPPKSL
jgi:hypothetical protein